MKVPIVPTTDSGHCNAQHFICKTGGGSITCSPKDTEGKRILYSCTVLLHRRCHHVNTGKVCPFLTDEKEKKSPTICKSCAHEPRNKVNFQAGKLVGCICLDNYQPHPETIQYCSVIKDGKTVCPYVAKGEICR